MSTDERKLPCLSAIAEDRVGRGAAALAIVVHHLPGELAKITQHKVVIQDALRALQSTEDFGSPALNELVWQVACLLEKVGK